MKKLRFSAHLALALAALVSLTATGRAVDIIYFSEVGAPTVVPGTNPPMTRAPGALNTSVVPEITMNVGDERTLHVWMDVDDTVHAYSSVAWSIDSSNAPVAHATNHSIFNGTNPAGPVRWQNTTLGALGATGETRLVTDDKAFLVSAGTGIGTGTGIFNAFPFDPGRDDLTNSFYLGTVTLRADAPGTTGLYFRTGDFKSILQGGGPGSIQYGANAATHIGNVVDSGDAITADLALADARIVVQGGPLPDVSLTLTPHVGTDLTGDVTLINSPAGTFVDAGGRTSGRINIVNYVGQNNDALPLFFDLVPGANADQLITDLNAIASRPFTASATTQGGADLVLRFPNQPAGADVFVDFDFGAVGVARVGIPEPSTLTLAAMSAFGLVGMAIRRRRAAKA